MVRNSTERFPAWVLWVMGLLTLLAASLLILSIVLGVRAGQRQLEIQRRQEAAIALADAIDFHAQGDYESALDAYKYVLQLEPGNTAAREGIQNVLAMVTAGRPVAPPVAAVDAPTATAPVANANTPATATANSAAPATAPPATPTTATMAVASSSDALMAAAMSAIGAGRWQEAVTRLVALRQSDSAYQTDRVTAMLFEAYVNLAAEKDNEDNLEEALAYFDKALQLRPNEVEISAERALIAQYLDVVTYFGADWPRAIQLLRELYTLEPDYRDVAARLQEALVSYGDSLVAKSDPCTAAEQYRAAAELTVTPGLTVKRDEAQTACETGGGAALASTALATTAGASATRLTPDAANSTPAPATAVSSAPAAAGSLRGRILYSARDLSTGRQFIAAQTLGANAALVSLQDDAMQPALRGDGQRLLFRNVRSDMAGLGAVDPGSGLLLRFTRFAEDGLPSWSPEGNRYVFASNREGDRIWRIYAAWAEADGETTNLGFGDAPAWHPASDLIVFRGCDATGNACGLWRMNSSGADRAPLTTIQADSRPTWSPNGRDVLFMSDGRDGNMEIYRLEPSSGQVLRLTDSPAIDGLPTVSPDGRLVAFVSNRDGAWKIWVVSIDGGAASVLTPINGDLGNWTEQGIQWVD